MLVSIDDANPLPIYLQIVRQVKEQILVGSLRPGDEVPSVRELGDVLGISLHTARSAYQELSDARLLTVRLGRRARIAAQPTDRKDAGRAQEMLAAQARVWAIDGLLAGIAQADLLNLLNHEIDDLLSQRAAAERADSISGLPEGEGRAMDEGGRV